MRFLVRGYMKNKIENHQKLVWQPKPVKKPEVEILYEEGKILPNSPEEDIELPMLRASYSKKQLRGIKRRKNNLKFKKKKHQRSLMKDLTYDEVHND